MDEGLLRRCAGAGRPLSVEQALDMLRGEGDYAEASNTGRMVKYDIINITTGETSESGFEESPDKGAECCRGRALFTDSEE